MRARAIPLLAAAAAGALAAPAPAAYAPRLEARVDPPTPSTPSALTLGVRQAAGEGAHRTEVVRIPPAFRFNPGFSVSGCTPEQEASSACPESSRVGTASADSELGHFSGAVHLTRDFRFVIFLRGFAGLVEQKVEGVLRLAPDGWVESVLDGLPAVRTTYAQVRLESGPRSLMLTPERCAEYPLEGRFTSHDGEHAVSRTTVAIAGCDTRPGVASLAARPRGRRLAVTWRLDEAGSRAELALARRVRVRPWVRWARAGSVTVAARAGAGRAALPAPVRARLRPGRYRVTLTTWSARGALADTRSAEVTVPSVATRAHR